MHELRNNAIWEKNEKNKNKTVFEIRWNWKGVWQVKFQDLNFDFKLRMFIFRFKNNFAWVVKLLEFLDKKQFDDLFDLKINKNFILY